LSWICYSFCNFFLTHPFATRRSYLPLFHTGRTCHNVMVCAMLSASFVLSKWLMRTQCEH
jgi:hypothetical protein